MCIDYKYKSVVENLMFDKYYSCTINSKFLQLYVVDLLTLSFNKKCFNMANCQINIF